MVLCGRLLVFSDDSYRRPMLWLVVLLFDSNRCCLFEKGRDGMRKMCFAMVVLYMTLVTSWTSAADLVPTMVLKWNVTSPGDVAVSTTGRVYVATGENKIKVFDTEGNYLFEWGSTGAGDGQFDNPSSIALSLDGRVYVADFGNNRIQAFNENGGFLLKWGTPCFSNGLCAGGNSGCVDPDGDGPLEKGDGQLWMPHSIAVDDQNNVYVYEVPKHQIQIFDSNGNFLRKVGPHPPNCFGEDWIVWPSSVAVDRNGSIYVGQTTGLITFSSSGVFLWHNSDHTYPRGITIDGDGGLYFGSDSSVYKYGPDRQLMYTWGSFCNMSTGEGCVDPDGPRALEIGDGQFGYGVSLDTDAHGNIYVSDWSNNRIQKFSWLPIAVTATT